MLNEFPLFSWGFNLIVSRTLIILFWIGLFYFIFLDIRIGGTMIIVSVGITMLLKLRAIQNG